MSECNSYRGTIKFSVPGKVFGRLLIESDLSLWNVLRIYDIGG